MKPAARYLLPLPLLVCTLLDWQPFAIDHHVSVQFPSQPQEMNLAPLAAGRNLYHGRMWFVQTLDATYLASRSHLEYRLTPQDTVGRRRYYSVVFEAILKDEQGKLVDYSFFPTPAGQGVEVSYKGLHKVTKQRLTKVMRCVVVDSTSYTFSFRSADHTDTLGLAGAEQRRRFFNSITVKL